MRNNKIHFLTCFSLFICLIQIDAFSQREIAITIDDPHTLETKKLSWKERNDAILMSLEKHKIKAALFVCGMRIDNENGKMLLKKWDDQNHLICNHSYSHFYYHSKTKTSDVFVADFHKGDSMITTYKNFTKLFRFPYLKEGNTTEKRDVMRNAMNLAGYKNGYVTVDASDWYIDMQIAEALKKDANADLTPYKEYFIKHILDRANYYDSLAQKVFKRNIKHTLLLHHSLLNALFLNDLLLALKENNWKLIDAKNAFKDAVFSLQPIIEPCGESIVWQSSKLNDEFSKNLRYPAEDERYEKDALERYLEGYKFRNIKR
ncbi:MAG: polysaccharide deacetylase family protein [Leadbetterella sp.]